RNLRARRRRHQHRTEHREDRARAHVDAPFSPVEEPDSVAATGVSSDLGFFVAASPFFCCLLFLFLSASLSRAWISRSISSRTLCARPASARSISLITSIARVR